MGRDLKARREGPIGDRKRPEGRTGGTLSAKR